MVEIAIVVEGLNIWQGIVRQERRLEYRKNTNNGQSNLNGKESLVVLN